MDGRRFRSLCADLDGLTVEQLRALRRRLCAIDARREVLARIDMRGQALERCVHCDGSELLRWGSTRTGLQRLRCKGCGRTFSAATGTVVAGIRPPEQLQQALEDMLGPSPSSCRRLAAWLAELARNSGNSRTGMLRVGILTGGALGIGAALVMAQFIGLALVFAAFAGGGATGYALSNWVKQSTREVGSDAVSDALAQTKLEGPSKRLRLSISGQ